jgi:hypothetical protein
MAMLRNAGSRLTGAVQEVLALAVAWIGAAVAIGGAAWILGAAQTGQDPGLCSGPTIASGVAFSMATLVSLTAAGATVVVGAYWSLGLRHRPMRVAAVVASVAAAVLALNAGAILTGCGRAVLPF